MDRTRILHFSTLVIDLGYSSHYISSWKIAEVLLFNTSLNTSQVEAVQLKLAYKQYRQYLDANFSYTAYTSNVLRVVSNSSTSAISESESNNNKIREKRGKKV